MVNAKEASITVKAAQSHYTQSNTNVKESLSSTPSWKWILGSKRNMIQHLDKELDQGTREDENWSLSTGVPYLGSNNNPVSMFTRESISLPRCQSFGSSAQNSLMLYFNYGCTVTHNQALYTCPLSPALLLPSDAHLYPDTQHSLTAMPPRGIHSPKLSTAPPLNPSGFSEHGVYYSQEQTDAVHCYQQSQCDEDLSHPHRPHSVLSECDSGVFGDSRLQSLTPQSGTHTKRQENSIHINFDECAGIAQSTEAPSDPLQCQMTLTSLGITNKHDEHRQQSSLQNDAQILQQPTVDSTTDYRQQLQMAPTKLDLSPPWTTDSSLDDDSLCSDLSTDFQPPPSNHDSLSQGAGFGESGAQCYSALHTAQYSEEPPYYQRITSYDARNETTNELRTYPSHNQDILTDSGYWPGATQAEVNDHFDDDFRLTDPESETNQELNRLDGLRTTPHTRHDITSKASSHEEIDIGQGVSSVNSYRCFSMRPSAVMKPLTPSQPPYAKANGQYTPRTRTCGNFSSTPALRFPPFKNKPLPSMTTFCLRRLQAASGTTGMVHLVSSNVSSNSLDTITPCIQQTPFHLYRQHTENGKSIQSIFPHRKSRFHDSFCNGGRQQCSSVKLWQPWEDLHTSSFDNRVPFCLCHCENIPANGALNVRTYQQQPPTIEKCQAMFGSASQNGECIFPASAHRRMANEDPLESKVRISKRKADELSEKYRTRILSSRAKQMMNAWYLTHTSHPYPSAIEKRHLAKTGGINVNQVSTWFCKRRARDMNTGNADRKRKWNERYGQSKRFKLESRIQE